MSVESCMQLMSQSKSMHPTYLSSTIPLSGVTWQTVPRDASCASLELSQGWGIHDVRRGSSCFGTFWRVLGASQVFIPEILAGAYFVARYQPEDFKQMDKSCLHLGQNLPKVLVRCEADIQSHA